MSTFNNKETRTVRRCSGDLINDLRTGISHGVMHLVRTQNFPKNKHFLPLIREVKFLN